jgi:hypothetical protein
MGILVKILYLTVSIAKPAEICQLFYFVVDAVIFSGVIVQWVRFWIKEAAVPELPLAAKGFFPIMVQGTIGCVCGQFWKIYLKILC